MDPKSALSTDNMNLSPLRVFLVSLSVSDGIFILLTVFTVVSEARLLDWFKVSLLCICWLNVFVRLKTAFSVDSLSFSSSLPLIMTK